MKFFGYTIAVAAFALLALTGAAFAGSVPIFTGPAGTNPINQPAVQGDLNSTIQQLNVAIGPGLTTGSISAIFTSGSINGTFQSQGLLQGSGALTTGTNCIRSSASGTCGTFSFFLTFVDSQGIQSFIPVYK